MVNKNAFFGEIYNNNNASVSNKFGLAIWIPLLHLNSSHINIHEDSSSIVLY